MAVRKGLPYFKCVFHQGQSVFLSLIEGIMILSLQSVWWSGLMVCIGRVEEAEMGEEGAVTSGLAAIAGNLGAEQCQYPDQLLWRNICIEWWNHHASKY